MCHLFVLASLSIMTGLFVILTPLTKLFPTQATPTLPDTYCRLLIFYLLWQLQSKQWPGDPGLLTQQTAQLWHKHSTATGYIDPDWSRSVPWAGLLSDWSVSIILGSYWLLLTPGHGWHSLCILLHPGAPAPGPGIITGLWLVRGERGWPLIGWCRPEAHLWLVTTS